MFYCNSLIPLTTWAITNSSYLEDSFDGFCEDVEDKSPNDDCTMYITSKNTKISPFKTIILFSLHTFNEPMMISWIILRYFFPVRVHFTSVHFTLLFRTQVEANTVWWNFKNSQVFIRIAKSYLSRRVHSIEMRHHNYLSNSLCRHKHLKVVICHKIYSRTE